MRTRFLAALYLPPPWLPAYAAPAPSGSPSRATGSSRRSKLPHVARGDRTHNLDFLFGALKARARRHHRQGDRGAHLGAVGGLAQRHRQSADDARARPRSSRKILDLAIKLLDAIVKIKPDYIEAWNRRATLYYMKKDYGHSLADIREVLKREPRHFGALSGLGLIMQDIGDDKQALEVYRRALAVYPRLQRIPDLVKTLQEKVEGRDI